jgi:methylphosphotriester-DNA--protein-cysteine methyltransferase
MGVVPKALGISQTCLNLSFEKIQGMTPAEAKLEQRLSKLFAALYRSAAQGLRRAIQACDGACTAAGVVRLVEQTTGIEMPLFLLTGRRTADDRLFRRVHPEAEAGRW